MPEAMRPQVDTARAAEEIKSYIDKVKLDHVDYGQPKIEMHPNPEEAPVNMPEVKSFMAQWEELFDKADKTTEEDGTGFPEDEVLLFEQKTNEIADLVNEDDGFWETLREEVIPLYDRSPEYETWKKHWKYIKIHYDPIPIRVVVTKKTPDPHTGKIKEEVVSDRVIPPGFVVKVMPREV